MEKSLFFPLAERFSQEPRRPSQPKPRERVRATPGRCRNPVPRGPPPGSEGSFFSPVLTCLVRLPRHHPRPFPTPRKTQVRERAEQARAQRRRVAGRSACVAAAILDLRRAAEAGTTRATPSVGMRGGGGWGRRPRKSSPALSAWIQTLFRTSCDYWELKN